MSNCRRNKLLQLALLVVLLIGDDQLVKAAPTGEGKQTADTPIQALESYLSGQLKLTSTNTSIVVPRLNEIIRALVSLGTENFATLDAENDDAGVKFKSLLSVSDASELLKFLKDFVAASKSCDKEALKFLVPMATVNKKTNKFLAKFAQSLVDKCWRFNLSGFVARIDKTTGKMSAALFELVDQIANRISNAKSIARRRSLGSITINDNCLPNDRTERLRSLKQLSLFSRPDLDWFLAALHEQYTDSLLDTESTDNSAKTKFMGKYRLEGFKTFYQQSFAEPCREFLNRMSMPLKGIDESGKLHSQSTLRSVLAQQVDDLNFGYMLEINRVCTQMGKTEVLFWKSMTT